MSLFRKTALDALSTPEQLNQPLQLLRPTKWLLLIALGGFSLTTLLWSIFGKIPVRISGRGVLIQPNSLTVVQSETSGQVIDLPTQVGDCLEQGEKMAQIDPVSQEIEIKAAKIRLTQMIDQDSAQDTLGEQQIQQLQSDIERVIHLSATGAISTDEINQRNRKLTQLRYEIIAANSQREQNIQEQRNQMFRVKRKLHARASFALRSADVSSIEESTLAKWCNRAAHSSPFRTTLHQGISKAWSFSQPGMANASRLVNG